MRKQWAIERDTAQRINAKRFRIIGALLAILATPALLLGVAADSILLTIPSLLAGLVGGVFFVAGRIAE